MKPHYGGLGCRAHFVLHQKCGFGPVSATYYLIWYLDFWWSPCLFQEARLASSTSLEVFWKTSATTSFVICTCTNANAASQLTLSTCIKDAGIAIRHSRGGILFYAAGSRNGFQGMEKGVSPHKIKIKNHIKKTLFCYRKIYWGRQTRWRTRAGSAGSDNSASWSCKRRVTSNFAQNEPI